MEEELVAQWQQAAATNAARRKAQLETTFASEMYDGTQTAYVRSRLLSAIAARNLDPRALGTVECRDTLCRVELSARPFELSRLAGSADFRIARLDMAPVADAGFRLTAYLYLSAEESSNQAAATAVANAP